MNKDVRMIVGDSTHGGRRASDYYVTPPFAMESLLEREYFPGTVWEPASGNGAIAMHFPGCMASDIRTSADVYGDKGVDFLKTHRDVNCIVTNPPYALAEEFVWHSLECADNKVAFLMKLVFLEGVGRYRMFTSTPLARVYVFSRRLNFDGINDFGGMMAYAWFVWEKRQVIAEPRLHWIL